MPKLVSDIARSVVKITARRVFDDGREYHKVAFGTGFFWESGARMNLVTNWHNVTGLNPESLRTNGTFFPNCFDISFWVCSGRTDAGDFLVRRSLRVPLYDGSCKPSWIEHIRRNEIDMAVLSFTNDSLGQGSVYPLNRLDFEWEWVPDLGNDCFVVGFPEGFAGPMDTPVWKRASIASEPGHPIEGSPIILVDTIGNAGLSGSPVIARSSGVLISHRSKEVTLDSKIGTWENFVGIYSGRMAKDGIGSQLGRVWKAELLLEILANGVPGHHPIVERLTGD